MERIERNKAAIIAGVVVAVLGIVVFLVPAKSVTAVSVICGISLLGAGVCNFIFYIRTRGFALVSSMTIIMAVLDVILGIVFFARPFLITDLISYILGAGFALVGIIEVVAGLKLKLEPGRKWLGYVFFGALCIVCAICFFIWPIILIYVAGAFIIFRGISLIISGAKQKAFLIDEADKPADDDVIDVEAEVLD